MEVIERPLSRDLLYRVGPRPAGRRCGTVPSHARRRYSVAAIKRAILLVQGGDDDGISIVLSDGLTLIGRARMNDVVVDQPRRALLAASSFDLSWR